MGMGKMEGSATKSQDNPSYCQHGKYVNNDAIYLLGRRMGA